MTWRVQSMQDLYGGSMNGKAVLITGCSSGIGHETAITLARHGMIVFATVRREADAKDLRALGMSNLRPICPFDLTNLEQIENAAGQVRHELSVRGGKGLYASTMREAVPRHLSN